MTLAVECDVKQQINLNLNSAPPIGKIIHLSQAMLFFELQKPNFKIMNANFYFQLWSSG